MKTCSFVLFISTFLVLGVTPVQSQTILVEDFDSSWNTNNPPAGWSILFTGDTSTNDWHRAPDLGFHPWTDNSTPYAALGPGETDIDMLVTPVLDFIGCQNVVLRCSLGFSPGTGYHEAKILASTDSGINYNREIANLTGQMLEPGLRTYDLPWAPNQRTVRIAFSVITEDTGIVYFVLDNISITASRRATDVGILRILTPSDTVDSGTTVTPQCQVKNFSNGTGTFWTKLTLGTRQDSVLIQDLAAGDSATATFRPWTADTAGLLYAQFSTALPGDLNPENDTASRRVFIKPSFFNDVAALAILGPTGTVTETTNVIPRGIIANNTPHQVTLKAYFQISYFGGPVYYDSISAPLAPNQIDTVSFSSWVATPPGIYNTILRVWAERDLNPENDLVSGSFTVRSPTHDVGVAEILSPLDTVPPGNITPAAKIFNFGTFPETNFKIFFSIYRAGVRAYHDSALCPVLEPAETAAVSFPVWLATRGTYLVSCSTALTGDIEPSNDLLEKTVTVRTPILVGWQEMSPLPTGAKEVKNGGALTILGNMVYALRGNKTDEFLAYSIETDSWYNLRSLPLGSNGKPVYKGGALTTDQSRFIYALKGNSQPDFLRYDVFTDSWYNLKPVPPGPSRKPVKGGSYMTYVVRRDTGYVYLLKGYRNEFWRYNTVADSWEELPAAPLGPSGKNSYKDGSFIVYDGARTLYAVKAKYNEVFAFDLDSTRWLSTPFQRFPPAGHSGREKKVKDGAGGVWWRNAMYCLKGGNTCEFWRFFPQENRWEELDTIPILGSTGKKKRVKAGGAIAGMGNGIFFILKGNKTNEFWCYQSPEAGPGVTEPVTTPITPLKVKLYPNPTTGVINCEIPAPWGEKSTVTIYDPSGRILLTTLTNSPQFRLDCRTLGPGVYFFHLRNRIINATTKLIVR
ncbi:MAG: T9SS type A sorting domain-containing protein [bacterium]